MRSEPIAGSAAAPTADASRRSRRIAPVAVGLALAGAAVWFAPTDRYVTSALVEVTSADPAVRLALARSAHESVLAKPVLLRAAATLIAAGDVAPAPALTERLAVGAGLAGARATGRDARLAATLPSVVGADPGAAPGTIAITATDASAETAAHIATSVADAFVADEDERAVEARRGRDLATEEKVRAATLASNAAHARLAALGGVAVDPAQAIAAAAAATLAAQKRIDLIHAILSSGSPPISDRKDVPDPIAAAQRTYLGFVAELAKARETLGERHMTVVSLRDNVAKAAAEVTASWKRLDRAAQIDLETARAREAESRKGDAVANPARRAEIEQARGAATAADATLAALRGAGRAGLDEAAPFKVIARAPVPSSPSGLSFLARLLLSTSAGLAGALVTWVLLAGGRVRGIVLPTRRLASDDATAARPAVSAVRRPVPLRTEPEVGQPSTQAATAGRRRVERSFFDDADPVGRVSDPAPESGRTARPEAMPKPRPSPADGARQAMREILSRFETIDPRHGVPTVMVAANGSDAGTSALAMSLAVAAAALRRRVLVVESERPRGSLAATADPTAEPMLVDVFGTLRIALPAERDDDMIDVAPLIDGGARIAATLARRDDTLLIDDPVEAYDLVIVDGLARDAPLPVDAYLRVARFTSARDDQRFIAACEAPAEAFLGTVVGDVYVPSVSFGLSPGVSPGIAAEPVVAQPSPAPALRGSKQRSVAKASHQTASGSAMTRRRLAAR